MSRHAKIGAGLFVILLAAAFAFWPRDEAGEIRVVFAGYSPDKSNCLAFVLTNTSRRAVDCRILVPDALTNFWSENWRTNISGHGTSQYEMPCLLVRPWFYQTPWRLRVHYGRFPSNRFPVLRSRLTHYAHEHDWETVYDWLTAENHKVALSPQMLGLGLEVSPLSNPGNTEDVFRRTWE